MQNIIQQQDDLKNLSQQQLVTAMQSGTYPQFLVLSELNRRKRMASDQARREAADDTNTVAQEVISAAGVPQNGIAQLAGAMNAKTDNTQNTGIGELMPKQPVRMNEGGTPKYKNRYEMLMAYLFGEGGDEETQETTSGKTIAEMINFGGDYEPVKKADGGVVKMQTAGQTPSIMSNIMTLMSPPVYDIAGVSKPRVAREPKQTALEELESLQNLDPDVIKAMEISKKLAVGRGVKSVLNEAKLTGLEALNLIAGAGVYIALDTAYKSLNALSTVFPQEEAKVILDIAQTLEDGQTDSLFKKHGTWLQRNLPRLNPDFAYTFDEREKAAEKLSLEELDAIDMARQAALDKAQTPVEAGGDPRIGGSLFAEGDPSSLLTGTYSFPRGTKQVGDPKTDGVNKLLLSQNTDVVPPIPAPINPPPPDITGSSMPSKASFRGIDDFPVATVAALNDPLSLGGKAKEDITRSLLAGKSPFEINAPLELQATAAADLLDREREFYNTDTFTPPSEIYGGADVYGPELQGFFDKTLENQQKAMPGGGGRSGLGALFAQTLENQQEGIPGGTDPNAKPTLQSRFDRAKRYLESMGENIAGMTPEDVITFAKKAGAKGLDLFDEGTTMVANKINEIQEQRSRGNEGSYFKDLNDVPEGGNQTSEDTTAQTQMEKLIEILNKQQGAINKQSGASSAALSEFLGGLEKDREFDKAMALVNAGATLMMPSGTIGEGFGKAIKAGTKTLQKGKDSYNKNKLQVLALQGRIDAAKAAAANRAAVSGAALSSRVLLTQIEDLQRQLEIISPMGTAPDGRAADKADELKRQIKEKNDQLNALIATGPFGSGGTGSDIFASYNLTG